MIESIVIQDPKIVSKNFSGKVDKHNPRGWRCFSVVIEKESLLEQLRANNWPIRVYYRKKFEEGETRESDKKYYIRVYVNYNYKKKPIIMAQGRYRDWETDRKSTRLNSSHSAKSRMPSSA